ncbi:hypothetical protein [Actinomadura terrae]|uniref:hypothetical protein n=1 Tax=Actinomadura terrae TaxID=604353 RepID=UPI001FA7E681|nr:hypothetical protein [Actinomadura terrae]
MSSSDEGERPVPDGLPYGWDVFADRPAPPDPVLVSPAAEMGAALQLHRSALNAERKRARAELDQTLDVAYDLVTLLAQWDAALTRSRDALTDAGLGRVHQQFRLLKDDALEILRRGGVTYEDPADRPLAEVEDRVEVKGWKYSADYTTEVVARTIDPIVLRDGAVVRPGLVQMGAPPREEEAAEAAEEQPAEEQAGHDASDDHDGEGTR